MSVNQEISRVFDEMAAALELLGSNPFRASSNERVARTLRDMAEEVADFVARDPETAQQRLEDLPGVGKGSARKILEFVETGGLEEHRELMEKVPAGLFAVLEVPGVGPKAAKLMWDELGITSLEELRARLESEPEAVAGLSRMGLKKVEKIKKALVFSDKAHERIPLGKARPVALEILDLLRAVPGVARCDYAGSLRRGRETIGDLDFLVACSAPWGDGGENCSDPEAVRERFTTHRAVTEVLARGETKCSVRLEKGGVAVQADLRLVPEEVYGAALMYFTGSKDHNVRLREIAVKKGMRLNEYGLFRGTEERPQDSGTRPEAAATEEEIYDALGLPFIPPELRQDRGELERRPARLIELEDVRAELHAHTTASDGKMSIEELARAVEKRGYHTLAITDHSQSSVIANGLTPDRLLAHVDAVREADAKLDGIRILAGAEVDILPDGRLDYDDDLLAKLDVVVASPHAALSQDPKTATARLLSAIRHPLVHVIGHPTGRLLGRRQGLAPDMNALFEAAVEHDKALELNSNWRRLDLNDVHLRAALEAGCKIAIDTDTHREHQLDYLVYGILTARRAGLEPASCINTWSADELHRWLAAKRTQS
jgi:DNA polymerase (family 10)